MKQILKKAIAGLLIIPALILGLVATAMPVAAQQSPDCSNVTSGGIAAGAECAKPTEAPSQLFGPQSIFVTITNILLFIIGAIAVIMLIIGGIRYVVSAGDQNAVTAAKNTILYAIIGIIVAFLAYAAVNFVSSQLEQGTNNNIQTQSQSTRQV